MSYNTKNYTEQDGEKTVIRGTLEIATGGKLTFAGTEFNTAIAQTDSTAATIADLKADFNTLLAKLNVTAS